MEESIANYFKRIVVMNKHGDYSPTARYDHSIVNQLFEENECKIMKIPKKLHSKSLITFYRNSDPDKLLVAHLDCFCEDPSYKFRRSKSKFVINEK